MMMRRRPSSYAPNFFAAQYHHRHASSAEAWFIMLRTCLPQHESSRGWPRLGGAQMDQPRMLARQILKGS